MWKLHFDKVVTQSGFTGLREKLNCLCQEFLSETNKIRQKVYLFKTSAFKNSHKYPIQILWTANWKCYIRSFYDD
jgi:hypothetical protein